MRPPVPPLLIACLVMSLNSYTQQVPPCLPQYPGPESNSSFVCNSSSLREFPSGFPSETKTITIELTQISNLGVEALQGLPELQGLYLLGNQLKTLPSGLFRNLPALHSLDLSGNLLEDLPADLFAPIGSLAYLSLGSNQLTELRPSWFESLEQLKILRLDHNHLKEIPPDCFRKLTLLTSLDLSSNLLHCLSPEMFRGLAFLTVLNLKNNPVASIAPGTFRGTPTLWILSLRSNSLTHVPPGLFQSLKNLERLDLSANEITSLEPPLVNVSSKFTLDLSGNPWACDCRLQALFNWAQEGNVDLFSKEDVVCAFPQKFEGERGNFEEIPTLSLLNLPDGSFSNLLSWLALRGLGFSYQNAPIPRIIKPACFQMIGLQFPESPSHHETSTPRIHRPAYFQMIGLQFPESSLSSCGLQLPELSSRHVLR